MECLVLIYYSGRSDFQILHIVIFQKRNHKKKFCLSDFILFLSFCDYILFLSFFVILLSQLTIQVTFWVTIGLFGTLLDDTGSVSMKTFPEQDLLLWPAQPHREHMKILLGSTTTISSTQSSTRHWRFVHSSHDARLCPSSPQQEHMYVFTPSHRRHWRCSHSPQVALLWSQESQ